MIDDILEKYVNLTVDICQKLPDSLIDEVVPLLSCIDTIKARRAFNILNHNGFDCHELEKTFISLVRQLTESEVAPWKK